MSIMSNKWLEISQGEGNKMYTLWMNTQSARFCNRRFIKNLSIDKEQAIEEATKRAESIGCELVDESMDNLKPILRGDDIIKIGKNTGKLLTELDDQYLCWVAQGGTIKKTNSDGDIYYSNVFYNFPETIRLANELAIEKGLMEEFEGKMIPKKLKEFILKSRIGFGHHFEQGQKVELKVEVIDKTYFESTFGTTYIITLGDKEGMKYQYKGGTIPSYQDSEGYFKSVTSYDEGTFFKIKASVKLDSYKNKEVTYLQRIKVLELIEP